MEESVVDLRGVHSVMMMKDGKVRLVGVMQSRPLVSVRGNNDFHSQKIQDRLQVDSRANQVGSQKTLEDAVGVPAPGSPHSQPQP